MSMLFTFVTVLAWLALVLKGAGLVMLLRVQLSDEKALATERELGPDGGRALWGNIARQRADKLSSGIGSCVIWMAVCAAWIICRWFA